MKKILTIISAFIIVLSVSAQDTNYVDPNYQADKAKSPKSKSTMTNRVYYGGTFGLSFGSNSSSVLIEPLIGFRMTEKLSTGIGIGYRYGTGEYYNGGSFTYHNYIGRIFSRYVIIPKLYAHIEYMVESYDEIFKFDSQCVTNPVTGQIDCSNSGRTNVPFLFVGGGFRSPAGKGFFVVQVLFNVLQSNENSSEVYPSGQPYLSIGYMGGF